MTKRRLLRWSLILVALAAFAVWLEPTRVVWGWLRGKAFYQGRPTSWWATELNCYGYAFVRTREAEKVLVRTREAEKVVIPSTVDGPPVVHAKLFSEGYELQFWRKPNWLAQKWHDITKGGPITLNEFARCPSLLNGDSQAEQVLRALAEQDTPSLRPVVDFGIFNITRQKETPR